MHVCIDSDGLTVQLSIEEVISFMDILLEVINLVANDPEGFAKAIADGFSTIGIE